MVGEVDIGIGFIKLIYLDLCIVVEKLVFFGVILLIDYFFVEWSSILVEDLLVYLLVVILRVRGWSLIVD